MNFIRWVQAHRRSILFLLAMLALAGAFAAFRLPVTLFPKVDFPRVLVSLDAGDRPADQMALQVTRTGRGGGAARARRARRALDHQPRQGRRLDQLRLGHRHGGRDLAGQRRDQPDPARPAARHAAAHQAHGPDGVPDPRLQPDLGQSVARRAVRPRALPAASAAVERQRRGAHPGGRRRARGIPGHGRPGAAAAYGLALSRRFGRAQRRERGHRGRPARGPLQALPGGVRHPAARAWRRSARPSSGAAPTAWCG